ncbi:aminotransferase class IV [Hyalangium sp.]|uniref:aminotransferase class IV n=1 Tax=Hyalangium sp. TaxID=2028555 RepID=UPI002D5C1E43|nr:aminotransferase class IV [Hyalangium sp.]HYI00795.1 aminotransferase class IV [Hyalangium sp.]
MGLTEGCVYVNGAFVPPAQATVPAFDHGYLYGDGLFETLRTYGGVPLHLDEHLARLEAGLSELAIHGAPPARELRATVLETLARAQLPEAYLRITVTRGVSSRGLDPAGCDTPTVLIAALPLRTYPATHYTDGIAATVLWARPTQVHPPPTLKSTSYQHTVMARLALTRRGVQEGFFVDESGHLTEGTVSNVFAVTDGALMTPPGNVCLPGITRAAVLAISRASGLRTVEEPLPARSLAEAEEVFITSSLAELVPVVRIDQIRIGAGRPGPVYQRLLDLYRQRITAVSHSGKQG